MTYSIVRYSGSYAGNSASLLNFAIYLKKHTESKFIVNSAIPKILRLIEEAVNQVFITDAGEISGKLKSIFLNYTGNEPASSYLLLVDKLSGILKGITMTGDYSPALKDNVLSYSEKLTAEILKVLLNDLDINVTILWPEDIELKVTSDFGNATYYSVSEGKINSLASGYYLIPGSYGITEEGKIARAGISAADYTGAFLTKFLEAPVLELWGMDYDFERASPEIISGVPVLERLTYSEAGELAYFDHCSFHPRAVEPLEAEHIPIHILNVLSQEGEISTIINTETYVEKQIVKSVASTDDISLLRLDGPGVGLKPGILAEVTYQLNNSGINIKSVITSQISINFILEKETGREALKLVRGLGVAPVQEVTLIDNVSMIGVIGHGMRDSYGVAAKIFGAVARSKINVLLSGSGASELASYLIVNSGDKEKSVRVIYDEFFGKS